MSDRVILAGGSGFIGSHLSPLLQTAGYEVVVLSRRPDYFEGGVRFIQWDGKTTGAWMRQLEGAFAVINLAGRSITARHNEKNRREILESRVNSVYALGSALSKTSTSPTVFLQTSAVGIYGDAGDRLRTEDSPHGTDFLSDVCEKWEGAFAEVNAPGLRKVVLRLGVVLHPDGGFLQIMNKATRAFLGGQVGDGRQYISWIHMADLCHMFLVAVQHPEISGVYNACSPNPATNGEFMAALRETLHRPWSPPVPKFAVNLGSLLTRTEPSLAFVSQRVVPRHFLAQDFPFRFPKLKPALENLLHQVGTA